MLDRPPLLALEYFVTTANLGTVRAAAGRLNVTPSAISHQIGRLEDFLQVELFHRYKRRLILTDAGRQYLEQLEGSFERIGQATRDIARRDKRRYLRILVPPTFLTFWLLPKLSTLIDANPDLALAFVDGLTLDPLVTDIDCAIEYRMGPDDRLTSEKLFDDEVVALASPEYIRDNSIASLEDVRRCTLIETERRVYSWSNVLQDFPWRDHCRLLTMRWSYQALSSALLGHGVALANHYNASELIKRGELVEPFRLQHKFYQAPSYFFSYAPHKSSQPVVQTFRTWLAEQIAQDEAVGLVDPSVPPERPRT